MSDIEVLSQRDARWKNEQLGFSTITTIGSHGCTITCIAMLAGISPREVNDRLKTVNGYALKNLVIWTKINEAIPWLEWEWRGYSYDNDKVLKAIKDNGGCLVEVDFDGSPRTNDKHWVLYVGNQKMHDPWNGDIKPTSHYPQTGYSIIKRIGNPPTGEDMSDEYGNMVWKSTQHDETVEYMFGEDKDPRQTPSTEIQSVIAGYKSQATTLRQELAKCKAEVKNREEQVGRLTQQIAEERKLNKELNIKLIAASAEIASMREDYEGRIMALQAQVDALAKDKGKLNAQIAVLESDLKECKAGVVTLSWHEHLLLAIKKLVRLV